MQFFKCLHCWYRNIQLKKNKNIKLPSSLRWKFPWKTWAVMCKVHFQPPLGPEPGAEGKLRSLKLGLSQHRWGDQPPQNGTCSNTWCILVSGICLSTTEHPLIRILSRKITALLLDCPHSIYRSVSCHPDTHLGSLLTPNTVHLCSGGAWSPICLDPLLLAFPNSQPL